MSYLFRSFFFATKWFDVSATELNSENYKPLALTLLADMLAESNFYLAIAECFRQLPITGVAGIVINTDTGVLRFSAINAYDLYLTKDDSFFHREYYTKPQLINLWKTKYAALTNIETLDDFIALCETGELDYGKLNTDSRNSGYLTGQQLYSLVNYYYYCYETKKYKRCVFSGNKEIHTYNNVAFYEIPVITSVNKLPDSVYGISLIAPSVGLIAEQEALRNYKLSNAKLGSYMMFISPEDTEIPDEMAFLPGKVFKLRDPNSLIPLQIPDTTNALTVQEDELLNRQIYQNCGLGAGTSANVARQGERVTAAEIESLKQSSGTRLNLLFVAIESSFVSPLLNATVAAVSKLKKPRKVYVKRDDSTDASDVYEVSTELLKNYKFTLSANGTRERLETVQRLVDFLTMVSASEALMSQVNLEALMLDIMKLYGFDTPEKYLKKQEPLAPPQEAPQMPPDDPAAGVTPENNPLIQTMLNQVQNNPQSQALNFTDTPNDPETQVALAQQQAELQALNQGGYLA